MVTETVIYASIKRHKMDERKYAGHTIQEIMLLIPGAGTCTPESIQERLDAIHKYYSPEAITEYLLRGGVPVEKRKKGKA